MTHDERVRHHTYDTLEGINEHAERIAKLEELVLDMWASGMCDCDHKDHCSDCELGFPLRMQELEVVE